MGTNQAKHPVDQTLSLGKMGALGLQHVLALYSGITVPLIVGSAMGLSAELITFLIAADLFTTGIATILQGVGIFNFSGIKLPVVVGATFTAVTPVIAIGMAEGLNAAFTSVMVGGIFAVLFAPVYGKILRFFPKVVLGSILTIIGFSLIPVAVNYCASSTELCLAHVPKEQRRNYYQLVLGKLLQDPSAYNNELTNTLLSFLDNDLNTGATAQAMFIHRNTIIFRLNKVKQLTGYDPFYYKNAMTLHIALMFWRLDQD